MTSTETVQSPQRGVPAFDPDRPVGAVDEDRFERAGFAEHVARRLCLPKGAPSIVVGLEADWGAGKTSCINMVKEQVKSIDTKAVIVDFQPWLIGNLNSVIEGFLLELATSIGHKARGRNAKDVATKLVTFAKFMAPLKLVPGVEPWGTMVTKTLEGVAGSANAGADLSGLSLLSQKADIQTALRKLNRPVVVVIDDVDRLPPDEVRTVFQLVKAVCDFDRTAYLLAYDPVPVRAALSYGKVYDGAKYLDKIVQTAYPLPRLGFVAKREFLLAEIERLVEGEPDGPLPCEEAAFNEALDKTALLRALKTPRQIRRLWNRIAVSRPLTIGHVNFGDLVAFEAICVLFPDVAEWIRRQPEAFLGRTTFDATPIRIDWVNQRVRDDGEDRKGKRHPAVEELIANRDSFSQDHLRSMLDFLFPPPGADGIVRAHPRAESDMRLTCPEALSRLLHCGLTTGTLSAKTVRAFLGSHRGRAEILHDLIESDEIVGWLRYAVGFTGSAVVLDAPRDLIDQLWTAMSAVPRDQQDGYCRAAADLILDVLTESPERVDLLWGLLSESGAIPVSEHVITHLLEQHGMWCQGEYVGPGDSPGQVGPSGFTGTQLVEAKTTWLAAVEKVAGDQRWFVSQPSLPSVLFRWGQLSEEGHGVVQRFVSQLDTAALLTFLKAFDGHSAEGINKIVGDVKAFLARLQHLDVTGRNAAVRDAFVRRLARGGDARPREREMEPPANPSEGD